MLSKMGINSYQSGVFVVILLRLGHTLVPTWTSIRQSRTMGAIEWVAHRTSGSGHRKNRHWWRHACRSYSI